MNPRHALQDFNLDEEQKHLFEDDEEIVTVCAECGTPITEDTYECGNGWDGVTKCCGCGEVEGETEEVRESDV